MKLLDRILILIFTMCLIIVSIWFSAVPIAQNATYYHVQFDVNKIYEHENSAGEKVQTVFYYLDGKYQKAKFTDEQLNYITNKTKCNFYHIINKKCCQIRDGFIDLI